MLDTALDLTILYYTIPYHYSTIPCIIYQTQGSASYDFQTLRSVLKNEDATHFSFFDPLTLLWKLDATLFLVFCIASQTYSL